MSIFVLSNNKSLPIRYSPLNSKSILINRSITHNGQFILINPNYTTQNSIIQFRNINIDYNSMKYRYGSSNRQFSPIVTFIK